MILTPTLWLPPEKPAIIRPADKLAIFPMPFFIRRRTTSISFLQGAVDGADLTTYTFASQNLGAADPDRWIVVCATGVNNVARSISSVTVGGISATKLVEAEASTVYRHSSIWAAKVPTGTTGNIVTTYSAGLARAGYAAYRLITEIDPTVSLFHSATDNTLSGSDLSVSINSASGGVVVASVCSVASAAMSHTWTNATENYDATYSDNANQGMSTALASPASSPTTITVTMANILANSHALCAASFY